MIQNNAILLLHHSLYRNSFVANRLISIFVYLRYLRLKLIKYTENNEKTRGTVSRPSLQKFTIVCNELGIIRKTLISIIRRCPYYICLTPFAIILHIFFTKVSLWSYDKSMSCCLFIFFIFFIVLQQL